MSIDEGLRLIKMVATGSGTLDDVKDRLLPIIYESRANALVLAPKLAAVKSNPPPQMKTENLSLFGGEYA